MSIDQNVKSPQADYESATVIENEIPTYRAISAGAIFSLIMGVLSILCYAHWFFLAFGVAALVLGILAERKIQRYPDMYTGRGFAQTGMTLALIFGLTSVTIAFVQGFLRERQAKNFAAQYQQLLTKGTLEEILFYGQPPQSRKGSTPEKMAKEMKAAAGPDGRMIEMQNAPIRELKERLGEPGAEVHFERIENHGMDGLNLFATALFDVHMPQRTTPGEKEAFALAIMKAMKQDGKYEWWVEDIRFPYTPASYVMPTKPVDDGHGHAPGESH